MFSHILVPLDGSEFAERALDYALSLASHYGSKISLLQVLPPGSYEWEGEMRAELPDAEDKIHQVETGEATLYLKEKEQALRTQGYNVTAVIVRGRAVPAAILDTVDSENADAIVMTTHGLTGIQRWMIGSVAERVSRHAQVPLLLVRATPT